MSLNTCECEHVCVGVCVQAHVSEYGRVYVCEYVYVCIGSGDYNCGQKKGSDY